MPACGDGGTTLFPTGTGGQDSGSTTATGPSTTTTSTGGGGSGGTGGGPVGPTIKPAAAGARRLIGRQYVGSIRTLLGNAAAAAATPPADPQLSGLEAIGATDLATAPSSVEAYEVSARAVASAAVADPATVAKIVPCVPNGYTDYPCLRAFVTSFGHQAYRRPLTDAEITRVTKAGVTAANAYASFDAGLEAAISTMLQSPYFLYIVELGVPDAKDPTIHRLTGSEMATRMSFFLLNSTPEPALLESAEKGELETDEAIRKAAEQMIARPEAKGALAAFYDEVYHLRDVATIQKDAALYPQWTAGLRAAMREETLRLIEDVVWTRDADAHEILTADYTFVNAELASFYGVAAPPAGQFVKVNLPAAQKRAGVLGHASILSRGAHQKDTSPTRRGVFVREALMCDPVPPPPPTVNPTFPEESTPMTAKQKLVQHMNDPSCSGCHSLMDPIGFALENFDSIGAYRTTDQGFPIDAEGSVEDIGSFVGPAELASLVAKDPRSTSCTVLKLYRHSMGHLETDGEQPAVDALVKAYADSGRSLQGLLVELCASRAFRLVGDPK
ncbi:Hypothetical protein A7982_11661 [Minicystis rosea]|nr:Hypothetical protein A7982_11661 [Minicystis rosea]